MSAAPASPELTARPAATGAATQRFLLLDGLRGLAAFAVILDHAPANVLGDLVPGRYLAVDFFFVLSGFVLANAYGKRLEGGWSVFAFMRARVIRLYPLYFAGMIIGLSLVLVGVWRGWETTPIGQLGVFVLFGLLFLPAPPIYDFGGGHLYPFNGPSWSLFFELVVNFIYGLIAKALSWRLMSVILVASAAALVYTLMRHSAVGGPGWLWPHFDAALARVIFDFFAGVALFRMRERFRMPALPPLVPALLFLAVIATPAPAEWRAVYDAVAAIAFMPLLVALASEAKVSGQVGRACEGLGAMSYGVYVLHVPLMGMLLLAAKSAQIDLPGLAVVGLIVVIAGFAAIALHQTYDGPMRRWLSEKLPGRASS